MAMGQRQTVLSERAVLSRVVLREEEDSTPELARVILKLDLPEEDRQRMHELAAKAREGTLTPAEKEAVATYERVGSFLSLLQAKARRMLTSREGNLCRF
jgi:hypothetical protein